MLDDGWLQGFKVGGLWRFSREAIETWLSGQQANLEVERAPTERTLVLPTSESLPLSRIQAIQGVFAEGLGVGTVTTAVDGTPLTGISNCRAFCYLILNTKPGRQR
jgi:hypothetical protein